MFSLNEAQLISNLFSLIERNITKTGEENKKKILHKGSHQSRKKTKIEENSTIGGLEPKVEFSTHFFPTLMTSLSWLENGMKGFTLLRSKPWEESLFFSTLSTADR